MRFNPVIDFELNQRKARRKRFMVENAPEIHVLDHKVRLLQAESGFRTSMDSVFVAAGCPAKEGDRVLDLGAGVGGASFCLLWRMPNTHVTGVEIQQSHVDLAVQNIALNDMAGRTEFVCADIREYRAEARFDHVLCNPPYLDAGTYTPSPSAERAKALGHEEESVSVEDWIDAGFHNLKSGGSFTIIHRADYTDKIIQGLGRKFGAVEIIPLYPKMGEAAKRVIVRAVRDRKTPAILHSGMILHEKNGGYTKAADAILREGEAIG
jgi:tRNA1(Val) A37 N6-methylase TrmN6